MLLGFGENKHLPGHLLCAFKCRRPEPQPFAARAGSRFAQQLSTEGLRLIPPPTWPWTASGGRGGGQAAPARSPRGGRGYCRVVPTHQRSLRRRKGAAGRALQSRAAPACRPRPLPAQNETRLRLLPGSPLLPPPPPHARPATSERDRRKAPSRPRKPALAAAQPRSVHGACAEGSAARARLRSREGAEAEPRPVAGGWGRKSEVSADVRVESGRSGRLRAEVRLGSLSAIVDPRSGEREGRRVCKRKRRAPSTDSRARGPLSGFLASGGGWKSLSAEGGSQLL